jgi:ATP-dependent RNA helicase RhlE
MDDSLPNSFDALGLHVALPTALRGLGYEAPTRVQAFAIPASIAGRDVRAKAETGSGKTLAFGLPIVQQLWEQPRVPSQRGNPVAALVLVPTRELAVQVADVLGALLAEVRDDAVPRLKVLAVYGGVSANPQMMALRGGVDLLVATPGRLLDLKRQNAVDLSGVRVLVLDEADRMLGLGFHDELQEIVRLLPATRQNLLFSATFPSALEPLMRSMLREPVEIDLPPVDTVALIEQHVYVVERHRKYTLLAALIEQHELRQVLVFASAKKVADKIEEKLNRLGMGAAVFHGDRSQSERQRVLDAFRAKQLRILVATDLAARGIDIEDLPVVINFELPRSPNDYTHRIGRTGRAGKAGLALSLICSDEYHHFGVIEKRLKRKFPRLEFPGFEVPSGSAGD